MAHQTDPQFSYMVAHHAQLERMFQTLLDAMAVNAPDVVSLWCDLDHALIAHMEAEERFVLPAFVRVDRQEAIDLLREHGELRELLLELGVAIELHELHYARSEEFIRKLRVHAAREDNLLYRWADRALDAELRRSTIAHADVRTASQRPSRAIGA